MACVAAFAVFVALPYLWVGVLWASLLRGGARPRWALALHGAFWPVSMVTT